MGLGTTKVKGAKLDQFKFLRRLDLSGTDITAEGMQSVARLPELVDLNLSDATGVNDAGIARVSKLPTLKSLTLRGTSLTDEALEHLQSLVNLRELNLERTSLTPAGVERLKTALPKSQIKWSPLDRNL